jgi:hypothetical protein
VLDLNNWHAYINILAQAGYINSSQVTSANALFFCYAFYIIGKYEFTMKLPPVPAKGHYEVRFGVSSGSSYRSMCQVYFGDNTNYLPAAGIPMDLRIGFFRHRFRNGTQTSNFGYTSDSDYYCTEFTNFFVIFHHAHFL